jgi:hypothetical protein
MPSQDELQAKVDSETIIGARFAGGSSCWVMVDADKSSSR